MTETTMPLMEHDVEGIGAGRHTRAKGGRPGGTGLAIRAQNPDGGAEPAGAEAAGAEPAGRVIFPGRSGAAPEFVIQEAWIGGVSMRKVDDLVQAMGLSGRSKSTVSNLCKDRAIVRHWSGDNGEGRESAEFLDRSLTGEWPYLWRDATCLKLRHGGRIITAQIDPLLAITTQAA